MHFYFLQIQKLDIVFKQKNAHKSLHMITSQDITILVTVYCRPVLEEKIKNLDFEAHSKHVMKAYDDYVMSQMMCHDNFSNWEIFG